MDWKLNAPNWLLRARSISRRAHRGQTYGDRLYQYHIHRVEEELMRYEHATDLLLAGAALHDVVEDTDWTVDDIEEEVGSEVAELVWRVTDEPGESRSERKQKTYEKIAESLDAVTLKAADRLANVRSCLEDGKTGLYEMYCDEHEEFCNHLETSRRREMFRDLRSLIEDRRC